MKSFDEVIMDSDQYEELCRHFIAEQTNLSIEDVKSVSIPNARRPGLPEYKHQIDLYWETGDAIALYLNIANAKWRASARVDQGEVLLLQQVRQQVAAHKALMITSEGFTAGAIAAAKDHGIALHVVTPTFEASAMPRGDRVAMAQWVRLQTSRTTSSLYSIEVVQRGLDSGGMSPAAKPAVSTEAASGRSSYEVRVGQPSASPAPVAPLNRAIGVGEARSSLGSVKGPRGGGGFVKK